MGRGWWLEGQDPAEDWVPQTLQPPEVLHCPFSKLCQALTTLPPVSNPAFLLLTHSLSQVSTRQIVSCLSTSLLLEPTVYPLLGQKFGYS